MPIFVWSEKFSTGLPDIDAQHRRLLELVEGIGARSGVANEQEAETLLKETREYVGLHFAYEEGVWARAGLPEADRGAHASAHRGFAEYVEREWARDRPLAERLASLHHFLLGWLMVHILGEDKRMAAMAGAASAQASTAGLSAETEAVFVEAIQNLYRDLSLRNTELATLNQGLEAEVTARTSALASANTELAAERAELLRMINELDETRLHLLQAERLASVGQLAAGVAHEVNNPLAIVAANVNELHAEMTEVLDALEAGGPVGDVAARREAFDAVAADATGALKRIQRIVSNLRGFSKIGAAGFQQGDVAAGLDETLELLAREIPDAVEIKREFGGVPPVPGDHGLLNQAFMHVLRNAAQAMQGPGTITVGTRVEGDWARIDIADTGVGMSAADAARACEPFFSTRGVGKGMGLGLSLCWGVMRQHGGTLELDSKQGVGTRVTLRLPLRVTEAGT